MRRTGSLLMVIGALSALALVIVRLCFVVSFGEPRHVVTSGFEEESLYAMWKWLNAQAVYTSPHAIPFSASYFNWLYYAVYGSVIKTIVSVCGLSDEWIPTIGRLFTFSCLLAACGLNTKLLSDPKVFKNPLSRPLAFSLSVLVWLGPLIGFWAMTVRPDGIALCFDLIAAYGFLRLYPTSLYKAILLAAVACYCSWAFKQINIVMPAAIGLFLLWQRRYVAMVVFGAIMASAYGLTLYCANEAMFNMLLFKGTAVPLSFDTLSENLINFIKKTVPILCLLGFLTVKYPKTQDNACLLGWCGIIAWAIILLPASSKVGSADNYHFIALLFMVFIVASKLGQDNSRILVVAGGLYLAMIVFAFGGSSLQGIAQQHRDNIALRACILEQKPPVFVMNHYGSLPWMNQHSPTFVLAYNYWFDRNKGQHFEQNGIGGLIQTHYFSTLILPNHYDQYFDGASLLPYYKLPNTCVGYTIYQYQGQA